MSRIGQMYLSLRGKCTGVGKAAAPENDGPVAVTEAAEDAGPTGTTETAEDVSPKTSEGEADREDDVNRDDEDGEEEEGGEGGKSGDVAVSFCSPQSAALSFP